MLRWEQLQLVRDVVFRHVRLRFEELGATWLSNHLGPRLADLLETGRRASAMEAVELRVALAFGEALLDSHGSSIGRHVERIAAGCEQSGNSELRIAGELLFARFHLSRVRNREAAKVLGHLAVPEPPYQGSHHVLLGMSSRMLGDPASASAHQSRAIHVALATRDRRLLALAIGNLGILHTDFGDLQNARRLLHCSLAIHREIGFDRAAGTAHLCIANLDVAVGRSDEAFAHYDRARRIHRKIHNGLAEGLVLQNMAAIKAALGHPLAAIELLQGALELYREAGSRGSEGRALSLLGACRQLEGDYDAATTDYQSALAIHREVDDQRHEGITLSHLAGLKQQRGDHYRAVELFDEAVQIHQQTSDRRSEGIARTNLARALEEIHEQAEANSHRQAAIAILTEIGDQIATAHALEHRSVALLRCGDSAGALRDIEHSIELAAGSPLALRAWRAPHQLGRCHEYEGRPAQAAEAFLHAVELFEEWFVWAGAERGRVHFVDEVQPLFDDAVRSRISLDLESQGSMNAAFEIVERLKARALLALSTSATHATNLPARKAEERTQLEGRLRALQDSLHAESCRSEPRKEAVDYLSDELTRAKSDYGRFVSEVARRHPLQAAEEGMRPPIGLEYIQREVLRTIADALLEFATIEDSSFLWIVRRDRVQFVELGVGREELGIAVARAMDPILSFTRSGDPLDLLGYSAQPIRELAGRLLESALPHLTGIDRLIVVPSGPLHGFPFELLDYSQPDAPDPIHGELLLDRFDIAYSPSATLLDPALRGKSAAATNAPRGKELRVLALGDPSAPSTDGSASRYRHLPGAQREVEAISRLFPHARCFLGVEASEANYRSEAPRADIIHLSCHGLLDTVDPHFSGVILAPTGRRGEDALLQAFEIAEIRLPRAPLVVVSACEVGGGRYSASEGLLSLARAFLVAGASAVIASGWPADDRATSVLMERFYERLVLGESPVSALASAKRFLHRWRPSADGRACAWGDGLVTPTHPYFWAGLTLLGAGGS